MHGVEVPGTHEAWWSTECSWQEAHWHETSKIETSCLKYLDANNLYGWALSQYIPYGDFKWCEPNIGVTKVSDVSNTEHILEPWVPARFSRRFSLWLKLNTLYRVVSVSQSEMIGLTAKMYATKVWVDESVRKTKGVGWARTRRFLISTSWWGSEPKISTPYNRTELIEDKSNHACWSVGHNPERAEKNHPSWGVVSNALNLLVDAHFAVNHYPQDISLLAWSWSW